MHRAVPPTLQCCLFFTIYPWQNENQKHPKYHIFSLLSVPVWRTRPTKTRISLSHMYRKLGSIHKNGRFHDTPVQRVQNVHCFDSCSKGQVLGLMPIQQESEKYGGKHGFGVICVSLHKGPGTKMGCSVMQH